MAIQTLIYALLGGLLPAIIWLVFWLKEDSAHPEPRGLILKTFIFGMIAVLLVLPFQKLVESWIPGELALSTLFLWVVFEELFKLVAAYFGGLHSREDNEPIDPMIYMITAALGFVALENTLFILGPLINDELVKGVITGNLRFIGASLLHIIASGIIGAAMALTFYKSRSARTSLLLLALIGATIIHTVFNFFILKWDVLGTVSVFALVWAGAISLLLLFEKIKLIAR